MDVIRGITHCDDVGDIFKNPILFRMIADWHGVKKGTKLKMRLRGEEGIVFSPDYYEFIREIFEDRTDMESFLGFVRELLIETPELYGKIQRNYTPDDIIKALLCIDELQDQLSAVDKITVSGVFKTKIVDIVRGAYTRQVISLDEDYDDEEESQIPALYYGLQSTVEEQILPISEEGKIIVRISDGNVGHLVTDLGGDEETFEVDRSGAIISSGAASISFKGEKLFKTREEIISYIGVLDRIIQYHFSDAVEIDELSEGDEQVYVNMQITFQEKNADRPGNIIDLQFGQYLLDEKRRYEKKLSQTKVTDTTQIESWGKEGLSAGIKAELPVLGDSVEQIIGKTGFQPRVIQKQS